MRQTTSYTRQLKGKIELRIEWLRGENIRETTPKMINEKLKTLFEGYVSGSFGKDITIPILRELLWLCQSMNSGKLCDPMCQASGWHREPQGMLSANMFDTLACIALKFKRYDLVNFLYTDIGYFHYHWHKPAMHFKIIKEAINVHTPTDEKDFKKYKDMLYPMLNKCGSRNVRALLDMLRKSSCTPVTELLAHISKLRKEELETIKIKLNQWYEGIDTQIKEVPGILKGDKNTNTLVSSFPMQAILGRGHFEKLIKNAEHVGASPEELDPFLTQHFRSLLLEQVCKKLDCLRQELELSSCSSAQAVKNKIMGMFYDKNVIQEKYDRLLSLTLELIQGSTAGDLKKSLDDMIQTIKTRSGRIIVRLIPSETLGELIKLQREINEKLEDGSHAKHVGQSEEGVPPITASVSANAWRPCVDMEVEHREEEKVSVDEELKYLRDISSGEVKDQEVILDAEIVNPDESADGQGNYTAAVVAVDGISVEGQGRDGKNGKQIPLSEYRGVLFASREKGEAVDAMASIFRLLSDPACKPPNEEEKENDRPSGIVIPVSDEKNGNTGGVCEWDPSELPVAPSGSLFQENPAVNQYTGPDSSSRIRVAALMPG